MREINKLCNWKALYETYCKNCDNLSCSQGRTKIFGKQPYDIQKPVKLKKSPFYSWRFENITFNYFYPFLYTANKGPEGYRKKVSRHIPRGAIVPEMRSNSIRLKRR